MERLSLVLASANKDKALEIRELLDASLGERVEVLERPSSVGEIEETGVTLEENARIKAQTITRATGLAAIADDTGLEVDALNGAPGVYSARYSGEHATYAENVAKLLEALGGVEDRRARFRTVALIAFPNGEELVAEGEVEGVIATFPRGDGGHGYDPIFVPDGGEGLTFAEMGQIDKHALSHRGRAVRALVQSLLAKKPDVDDNEDAVGH